MNTTPKQIPTDPQHMSAKVIGEEMATKGADLGARLARRLPMGKVVKPSAQEPTMRSPKTAK